MSSQSQEVPIWSEQTLSISTYSQDATKGPVAQSLSWDPNNYNLKQALLLTSAQQPYQSGAEVHFYVNGQDVQDYNWGAFDQSKKSNTTAGQDITSIIVNGTNNIKADYHTAYTALSTQTATVTASVQLTLTYIGPVGKASTSPVTTTSLDYGVNLSSLVLIGALAGAALIGVIIYRNRKPIMKTVGQGAAFAQKYGALALAL